MPGLPNNQMTNEELLMLVAETYADPLYWEPVEKDTGAGIVIRRPWAFRDRGFFAKTVLDYIKKREAT